MKPHAHRLRIRSTVISAVLLVALQPSTALATYWSQPTNLNPQQGNNDALPQLQITPDGVVWAFWSGPDINYERWNGQSWSAPLPVNTPETRGRFARTGCAPDGSIWVLWETRTGAIFPNHFGLVSHWTGDRWTAPDTVWARRGATSTYEVAPISRDEAWIVSAPSVEVRHVLNGSVVSIDQLDPTGRDPDLTVDRDGVVWVAWETQVSDPFSVRTQVAYSRFVGGAWSEPGTLTGPVNLDAIHIRSDAANNKLVVFKQYKEPYGQNPADIMASRYVGEGWTIPERISDPLSSTDSSQIFLALSRSCRGSVAALWVRYGIFDITGMRFLLSRWDGEKWSPPEVAGRAVDAYYIQFPDVAAEDSNVWIAYTRVTPPLWWDNIYAIRSIPAPSVEGLVTFEAIPRPGGNRIEWEIPSALGATGLRIHRAAGSFGYGQVLPPEGSVLVYEAPPPRVREGNRLDRAAGLGTASYWLELGSPAGPSAWAGPRVASRTQPLKIAEAETVAHLSMYALVNPGGTGVLLRGYQRVETSGVILIFDIGGRLVQRVPVVSDGSGTPVSFTAKWDGRTRAGVDAPSGIYFAKLQGRVGAHQVTTKLLLLR